MKLVIAGGTGFLGNPLAWSWAEEGHDVRILTRSLPAGEARHEPGTGKPGITRVGWSPDGTAGTVGSEVEGATAVVNLAGESIAGKRWSESRKQQLRDSRILPTRTLATAIAAARTPPPVFISASGVGYYGDRGSEALSENAAPGGDFLARLCVDWEAEATKVTRPDVRVVTMRNGIALEKSGGALPQMARPFRFFAGGPIGSGRQYFPWIHRHDWVELVRWIVETPGVRGPLNATAPHPVTNAEFSRALGRALHRPSLLPVPPFALKIAVGELAESLLASQRALPGVALAHGYHFRYPEIDIAFRGIYGD
jgi:uncharacterized protein (TIGR01777 family)